jgi:uncharacterized protein (TIRG00374 family)
LFSVGLIVLIFVGVIPKFASYQQAWVAIQAMSRGWWIAIVIAATVNQLSFVWPYQAVLVGLRFGHGFEETQTTTAISDTVPAGGAIAIGMTFRMFGSFGFSNVAITTAVVTTGIWNLAVKLGLPIVALVLLTAAGQNAAGSVGAAVFGVVVIGVAALVVWLVYRTDASARKIGRLGDRIVNWARHFAGKAPTDSIERAVLRFREQTNDIVRQRGWRLSATVVASQFALFVLVAICVRAVGISSGQVTLLEVLWAFAVARLVSTVPITPGALGTEDAALIAVLTAAGANSDSALAADLVWRATTVLPPIFIGVVTYLIWRRGEAKKSVSAQPIGDAAL